MTKHVAVHVASQFCLNLYDSVPSHASSHIFQPTTVKKQ